MAWKRLTFILIPHSQSTIKQMSVPRSLLYGVLFFLVAGIGMMVFYITGFKGKSFYAARAREIAKENEVLELQLAVFDSSVAVIQTRVSELDSLNRSILKESNISARDLQTDQSLDGRIDGRGYRLSAERVLYLIDRLETETRSFAERYDAINTACLQNAELLRRIPSIRPAEGPILKEFGPTIDETSGRRKNNEGVNINNVEGTPVVATADGVISRVTLNATDENGIYVVIDHGNGYETYYTHLRPQVLVKTGQSVKRGQQIGSMGRTGIMIVQVASHLLYKIRYRGDFVDPAKYFFASRFNSKSESRTDPARIPAPRS